MANPITHGPSPDNARGASVLELVVVLAVVGVMAGLAAPATRMSSESSRVRDAAGFFAARVRLARQHAVFRSAAVGLVFDQTDGRWQVRVCHDGNGTGIRRAEIASGTDPCTGDPFELETMFPGVTIAVDPAVGGPDGDAGSSDPVRFGSSDIASFSPEGTATAGSLYLRSGGEQFVVRIGNITGRTRLLRYDRGTGAWGPS